MYRAAPNVTDQMKRESADRMQKFIESVSG